MKNIIKKILKKIDIFGARPSLYINKNIKNKTLLGGVASCLFFTVCLIIIYFS